MHIAIITEYNPFHMGHEYQLSELRKAFPDACITAIMGGTFSQRGEPYITTPYIRAKVAVRCGADLVVELPFPFSCAPAKIFARAGVEIAAKIGADILAFGSECGDIEYLKRMNMRLDSEEFEAAVDKAYTASESKMRVFSEVYKELYGEELSESPNDILALEYLEALENYPIEPYTVKRIGDFFSGEGGFASATSIRHDFKDNGISALSDKVPKAAEDIYNKAFEKGLFGPDFEKLSSAVVMKFQNIENVTAFSGGGLLNHIRNAARHAKSIEDICKAVSTKRYTRGHISRCMLYYLLNVTREDLDSPVYYTKLLAANDRGRKILRLKHDIEIITKPSDMDFRSEKAYEQYVRTFLAERAFSLCFDGEYHHLRQTPKVK